MDEFDSNKLYEVPDPPDRLKMKRPIDQSSKPSRETVDTGEGTNWYLSHGDLRHPNKIYLRRRRDTSHHDARSAAPHSPKDLFRQADLARSMLEPDVSKSELGPTVVSNISGESAKMGELGEKSLYPVSHPTRCRDSRRRVANREHKESSIGSSRTSRLLLRRPMSGCGIALTPKSVLIEENASKLDEDNLELMSRDKGKGVDLCNDSQPRNGCTSSSRIPENNNPSEASCQHPTNPVGLATCFQSSKNSSQDNGNGMNLCRNIEPNRIPARSLRSTGRRRLVRNGFISPINIEQGRRIGKAKHDHAENNAENNAENKGKGVDLCNDSQPRNGCTSSSRIPENNNPSEAGCQHPTNPVGLATCFQSSKNSSQDNGNGMNLCRNIEPNRIPARSLRSTGRRRLVRNGFISPINIEQGRRIGKAKHDHAENNAHEIHIISPDSDDRRAQKMKEKVTVDDAVVSDDQHVGDNSRLGRAVSLFGKEVSANADEESGTDSSEDEGWRTTSRHFRKPSVFPFSSDTARASENGDAASPPFHRSARGHRSSPTAVRDDHDDTSLQHQPNIILVSNSQTRNMRGKRKFSLTRRRTGECSTSTSGDPGTYNLQSSGQASNLRSGRGLRPQHDGIGLGPVIDVDDLQSPEVVYNSPSQHNTRDSNHSEDRARQLESDELLARQLQEELYNETPRTGGMQEIDATIGWSLLQEEEDYRASRRRDESHRGNTSSSSTRTGFHQSFTRVPNRARRSMSNRMAQLRRELNRPVVTGDMGLEMRLDFLEGLELAFGDRNDTPSNSLIHRIQRDFNENDYEMLLALDENNNNAGASESRINNLPQSVIQIDSPEETCAVCLEAPALGDTIRHLPCLHKFHKECIDTWLRRRASCPICKSDIT
ncbi:Uncharacterized protein M6B38_238150 [Iris pallida]|uniref:RING-type domain-containing protein n=1 Tax=Iris pallida TaxID=29817 RepID=A0AAX6DLG0_IRIPA|nr:Uncharacterized protein M6B38_238150 [Iris pallida]